MKFKTVKKTAVYFTVKKYISQDSIAINNKDKEN